MEYQENREKRIHIFENTLHYCERTACLAEAIIRARKDTVLYRNPLKEFKDMDMKRYKQPCGILSSRNRILETAGKLYLEYRGDRIGILNFASAVSPGGGVIRGGDGDTQEEYLCRCSTLYPCLNTIELRESYFDDNRKKGSGLDNDACIYTPGVICIKGDDQELMFKEPYDWFPVDVISCAVPLRKESSELLTKRVQGVLRVAAGKRIDIMVIGVSDYDGICHFSDIKEQILKKALKEYCYSFKAIVFAGYGPDRKAL